MAVIDVFAYNGEVDVLEIHLNVLDPYVDQFVIVEAPTTFSGQPKPLYYERDKARFSRFHPKIKYFVIDEAYSPEELAQAESSPHTVGAAHWKHEFLQRESIKKALAHLGDDEIVYIGDVDELWEPGTVLESPVTKLHLRVYSYYLDNRSDEQFWGTITGKWGAIKGGCFNHLKMESPKTSAYNGWHFTSMGGYEEVKRKLEASYTRESYWTDQVERNLRSNVEGSRDFLGRGFKYSKDDSEWPQRLKENKEKYQHLCLK